MPELSCADVRAVAPDVALGDVVGAERAAVLEHLAGCTGCRALVEGLVEVADQLLLLAPEAEPPVGLESRVTGALGLADASERSTRRRRFEIPALVAAVAAVVAMTAGLAGWNVGRRTSSGALDHEYVAALHALGGSSLAAGRLSTVDGTRSGEVFLYRGQSSWVFVEVSDPRVGDGDYTVDLIGASGWTAAGSVRVAGGHGAAGIALPRPPERVTGVEVVARSGQVVARSNLAGS